MYFFLFLHGVPPYNSITGSLLLPFLLLLEDTIVVLPLDKLPDVELAPTLETEISSSSFKEYDKAIAIQTSADPHQILPDEAHSVANSPA